MAKISCIVVRCVAACDWPRTITRHSFEIIQSQQFDILMCGHCSIDSSSCLSSCYRHKHRRDFSIHVICSDLIKLQCFEKHPSKLAYSLKRLLCFAVQNSEENVGNHQGDPLAYSAELRVCTCSKSFIPVLRFLVPSCLPSSLQSLSTLPCRVWPGHERKSYLFFIKHFEHDIFVAIPV